MPIRQPLMNQIPYLERYEPFTLPSGLEPVDNISDMITYDFKPVDVPTEIFYTFGTADLYVKSLNIKNITTNAEIELTITYPHYIFHISSTDIVTSQEIDANNKAAIIILAPEKNTKLDIILNNGMVDSGIYTNVTSTNITISAKNLETGVFVTRRPNTELYRDQYFPSIVRIR